MISDTGIGMSKDYIKNHLFHAYDQEHTELTDKYAGSGLGLAIVKSLVDIMGGIIEVESELGVGTSYRIRLDFEVVEGVEAVQEKKNQEILNQNNVERLKGKKVLLCEDHPVNAEITRRLLEKTGCQIVWCVNGKEGLERFKKSSEGEFDAILMDIRMPVMDGLEATREIRALDRGDAKKIPIIAMTANAYDSDIRNSLEAGMTEHLSKPVSPEMLFMMLGGFM